MHQCLKFPMCLPRLFALAHLLAVPFNVHAEDVWAVVQNGVVTGFYANAEPVPAPTNCCTVMDRDDPRMLTFLNPAPTPAQRYDLAIAAGIVVTSSGTPTLNGTYSVAPTAQRNFASIAAGIGSGQGLPHGVTTISWLDVQGAPHVFTAAQILDLAGAVRDYVYDLQIAQTALEAGVTATWPSSNVTIP